MKLENRRALGGAGLHIKERLTNKIQLKEQTLPSQFSYQERK